jgi:hypothetical protein
MIKQGGIAVQLVCYALHDFAPTLVAARPQRQWMDDFPDRHAYRCLPLTIANAHGWEVLCPIPIEIEWNGGPDVKDLVIRARKTLPGGRPLEHFCRSNFSRGVATFHVDYLFQTDPGWDLLTSGPFNLPKDNAAPLTGIIETDWLPYPFTMNWQVLRKGVVRFEEDEPFCFIFPVKKQALLECQPEIRRLSDNAELSEKHAAFRESREAFMQRFHANDPATIKQAWQRHYFVGRHPDGTLAEDHLNKLRLAEPIDRRDEGEAASPVWPAAASAGAQPAAAASPIVARRSDPRWRDDSLLNEISADQDQYNEAGRRRIDGEGHLTDWSNTYVVRSAADAAGCNFLVVDDLLTAEQCGILSRAFDALSENTFKSEEIDPFWNNRMIWYADVAAARPAAAKIMLDAQRRAIAQMAEFYQLTAPIYPDLLQMVTWKPGMYMQPHADNANPDGSPHAMAYRDLSGIIYLNDDYDGGELYFTALDIAVKPRRGMFVGVAAGFYHEHAVLRVDAGTRLTMPFFLTFDPAKADPLLMQDGVA